MPSIALGLLTSTFSVTSFGAMYVWLRKHDTADGVFAYWLLCVSISAVGFFVDLACGLPQFQPLAMLGGCLWAMGNATAVPLINILGLGVGMLLWASVTTLVGWAIGRFGFPGVVAGVADMNPWLNYIGVVGVMLGGVFFAAVKPEQPAGDGQKEAEKSPSGGLTLKTKLM